MCVGGIEPEDMSAKQTSLSCYYYCRYFEWNVTLESFRTVVVNVKNSRMWLVASGTHFTGESIS